jgi:hypothetical protein
MVAMPKGDRRVSMVLENETEKVWITQDPSPCDGTHASVWQLGQSGMSTWAQSQRVSFVMHPSLVAILKTLLMFKVYGDMTKSKLLTSPLGQLWTKECHWLEIRAWSESETTAANADVVYEKKSDQSWGMARCKAWTEDG